MKTAQKQPKRITPTLFFAGVFFFCVVVSFFSLFAGFNSGRGTQTVVAQSVVAQSVVAQSVVAQEDKVAKPTKQIISSYTTYYNAAETGRSQNILIAASLINGVTIQPYGEFSFNQTVGRRTEEAGFQQAKIIVNGEYVLGTGGGVCQVSTTLYNAALKSGLTVTEYHPHSLQIHYVAPSRDAMVSSHSDLKFCNPHAFPVTLTAKAAEGVLRISFSGQKDGYRYEISSQVLSEVAPPPPIVREGEEEKIVRSPKNGVKSEAYLEKYYGDKLVSRVRLRVDEYRPVQGIIVKKIGNKAE